MNGIHARRALISTETQLAKKMYQCAVLVYNATRQFREKDQVYFLIRNDNVASQIILSIIQRSAHAHEIKINKTVSADRLMTASSTLYTDNYRVSVYTFFKTLYLNRQILSV